MARGRMELKQKSGESDKDFDLRREMLCLQVSKALSAALTAPTDPPAGWNKASQAIRNQLAKVKVEFTDWAPSPGGRSVLFCTFTSKENQYDLTHNTANGQVELGESDVKGKNRKVVDLPSLLERKIIITL